MAETQLSKIDKKRDKQSISIPFIWEERPGTPKKDWKPTPQPITPAPSLVKLVVSVPFGWEEKPGTPLSYFAPPPTESPQQAHSITLSSPPIYSDHDDGNWSAGDGGIDDKDDNEQEGLSDSELDTCSNGTPNKDWKPTPPPITSAPPPVKLIVSVPFGWEEKPGTPLPYFQKPPTESPQQAHSITLSSPPICSNHDGGSAGDSGIADKDDNKQEGLSDSELDTCSNGTDDSFSSAPCLLANGLISAAALSGAVPVKQSSLALTAVDYAWPQSPGSPVQQSSLALTAVDYAWPQSPGSPASDTESIASSYATGNTSLAGASFLEWLFPLLVPNSRIADKVECIENDPSHTEDLNGTEFLHENNCSEVRRPLLTLGELIVMSRRRSCQRKVNKLHKQPTMDFIRGNAFGCWMFGSGNGINAFHKKWKRQLQLKLI